MNEEIIDIVDGHDQVVGQISREEFVATLLGKAGFRSVNVFIENDQGLVWIPRRAATKKSWPLGLDVSAGGCVSTGESYEQAFAREVQEEINIDVTTVSYKCVAYLTPTKDGVAAFTKVYKIFSNETPLYSQDEFCESFWLTPRQVMDRIDSGEVHKGDLPKLLRIVYEV